MLRTRMGSSRVALRLITKDNVRSSSGVVMEVSANPIPRTAVWCGVWRQRGIERLIIFS